MKRVFGGTLLAQALVAAGRTRPDRFPLALHATFIAPARLDAPVDYEVLAHHDGRSMSFRELRARQEGRVILVGSVTLGDPVSASDIGTGSFPDMPDDQPTVEEARTDPAGVDYIPAEAWPFDWRVGSPPDEDTQLWYVKPRGDLPDDHLLRSAALAYVVDRVLLGAAAVRAAVPARASLDHAMWFAGDPLGQEWVSVSGTCTWSGRGRALVVGEVATADGTSLATVSQHGLLIGSDRSAVQ